MNNEIENWLVGGPDSATAAAAAAAFFLQSAFRKPKRIRTAFTPSQLLKLENAFEGNHYVVGQERKELAKALSLTETQVNIKTKLNKVQICQLKTGKAKRNNFIYSRRLFFSVKLFNFRFYFYF